MASVAEETLRSTEEKANFQRLTRLLMCGGIKLLREKFDSCHLPTDLPLKLADPAIQAKLRTAKLLPPEWRILYPSPGVFGKSSDFDITLTFRLLRTICGLTAPSTGWNNLPANTDRSIEADLVRIKFFRNSVYGHTSEMEITDSDFLKLWKEIREALLRIAGSLSAAKKDEWNKRIEDLLHDPLTPEAQRYAEDLKVWYEKDLEVKYSVIQLGDRVDQLRSDMQTISQEYTDQIRVVDQKLDEMKIQIKMMSMCLLQRLETHSVGTGSDRSTMVTINDDQQGENTEGNYSDSSTVTQIWKYLLRIKSPVERLLEYLKGVLGVEVKDYREGSLVISVICSSLQALERLWDDYCSGHLSQVVQQLLVTPEVLKELGLSRLELRTKITVEEYKKCKGIFLRADQVFLQVQPPSKEKPNIAAIDDIRELLHLVEVLGASTITGFRSLDEMKSYLMERVKSLTEEHGWIAGEPFSVLTKARHEDVRKRETLYELFHDTEDCLNNMDDELLDLLEQNLKDFRKKIALKKRSLKQSEFIVLVAGETSSGKTTLINLLLEERLLPTSILSNTTAICELRYGTIPKLVAHLKHKDPASGLASKIVWLDEAREKTPQQRCLDQIRSFFTEMGSHCKKIEVFWPHVMLKQGIVIVDSPGFGNSTMMDDAVKSYLTEASAFIYVINTPNAGGVQKDRLLELLEYARTVSLENQAEVAVFTRALFVCNKWDAIEPKEADEVKSLVIQTLKQTWPSVNLEAQIIFMSLRHCEKGQDFGIITTQFADFMKSIQTFILSVIDAKLQTHWRWIYYLLSRMAYLTKALFRNSFENRGKETEKIRLVAKRLQSMKEQQGSVQRELQAYLENKIDTAVHELSSYLKSPKVKEEFTSWTSDDVPVHEDSWAVTDDSIKKTLRKRLGYVIRTWEEESHVFADSRTSLVKHFQQRFNLVEHQLQIIESAVTTDNESGTRSNLPQVGPDNWDLARRIVIGVTSPIWAPLGLVALTLSLPLIGVISFKETFYDLLKQVQYEKNKVKFMKVSSEEHLSSAANENYLRSYVREEVKESQAYLSQVVHLIPQLIEADEMLCQKLRNGSRLHKEKEKLYESLYQRSLCLQERAASFGIQEVGIIDINCDDLEWIAEKGSFLGTTAWATVFKGKLKRQKPVALKIWKDEINGPVTSSFLAQIQTLRKLTHPFIVTFYGAALLKEGDRSRGILVMELCRENLRRHIFFNVENIPGLTTAPAATKNVVRWAGNIADALKFIHSQGVVHRDLKLENTLLSYEDVVKIADVDADGVEAAYTAPELISSSFYDGQVDIYSFGIVMWEMWYGKRAFSELQEDLAGKVVEGQRPSHVVGQRKPPNAWENLFQRCWAAQPENRPTAEMCQDELTALCESLFEEQ